MKKETTQNKVPCPKCKTMLSPASLMAVLRAKKMSKQRIKEIASMGGIAAKKARLAKKKA